MKSSVDKDKDKIKEVFNRYYGLMYHTAFEITGNRHDAEDAVQNAMCYFAEHPDKLKYDVQDSMTRNLAYIIAKHRAYNIVRDRKPFTEFDEGLVADYGFCMPDIADNEKTDVEGVFARLPSGYRDILILKYLYGYSSREISNMFKTTVTRIYRLTARAKSALKNILEEKGT